MINLPTPWLAIAIAVVVSSALSATVAYRYASAQGEARRMQCEQAREAERRQAADTSATLLARAQDAQADAARRLAAMRTAHEHRLKEVRRDVYAIATGRECLSGDLRLRLNAAIAGSDDMPASTGAADPAATELTADPGEPGGGATDRDIAGWALEVFGLYDECRARIDAIRHWDEVTHGK